MIRDLKKHFEKESIHLNPKTTIQISQQQSFENIVNPPSTIEKFMRCNISKQGSIFWDNFTPTILSKYFICWSVYGFVEFRGKYLTLNIFNNKFERKSSIVWYST